MERLTEREFSALPFPFPQGYNLCLGGKKRVWGKKKVRCDCMAMLGPVWGGTRTDPHPSEFGDTGPEGSIAPLSTWSAGEWQFTDEACHTMACRKLSGNGWMMYQKRRSPNNSLVCWTLRRAREETRAKNTLPRAPDQGRQVGPCNGGPPAPRVTSMRQGGRGGAQTTTLCPML